jgi:hypothetical protein
MRRRTLLVAAASVLAGSATSARVATAAAPVALELFTSQGCSSCPPADRLLGELASDPAVVALAWHVDYWNGLGWADPFASAQATARQRAYADRLGTEVYTPALVVGGATMVVGSDRGAVAAAIRTAPEAPVAVSLRLDGGALVAEIGAAGRRVGGVLAFYDPEHDTAVAHGENGGRRLREYRIVRQAMALEPWDGSARRLEVAAPAAGQGAVVLVQDADLRVVGIAELRPTRV